MQKTGITTQDEYRAALERIVDLAETAPDSEELASLVAESNAWEAADHRSASPAGGDSSPDDPPSSRLPGSRGAQ